MRWPWVSRKEYERLSAWAEKEIDQRCANIRDLEEQVAHWYGKYKECPENT